MPVKIVCPTCKTGLDADEDLLGATVKCEECGATFTARAAARPDRREDRDAPRPRSRTRTRDDDDEDDYDDRPRKRRKAAPRRKTSSAPYVLIGGGLALFALVAFGGVMYFLFSGKPRGNPAPFAGGGFAPLPPNNNFNPLQPLQPQQPVQPQPKPPAAGAVQVTLSNARWGGGGGGFGGMGRRGDFSVDYTFTSGQRPFGGRHQLKWKYADGTLGTASANFLEASGTLTITVIGGGGGRGGAMEIWMEEGGFGGGIGPQGTKVSNSVTLN